LEGDGEVKGLHGVVDWHVVLVQVPVVVHVEDGLVILKAWSELNELIQGRGDLKREKKQQNLRQNGL
jgi:hypothetical protein